LKRLVERWRIMQERMDELEERIQELESWRFGVSQHLGLVRRGIGERDSTPAE